MNGVAGLPRPLDYPGEWPPDSGRYGPNPRQQLAHELAPFADELLFGGARGGGKTDFVLAEALRRLTQVPGLQAVFFRRTYRELSGPGGAIPRLLARMPKHLATWRATDRTWTFGNGSVLTLTYLETAADVQAWLGLEVQLMVFDQVEQLPEDAYTLVRTSLRVTGETAATMRRLGLRPASIATANPGGRGHAWVKKRFVDAAPEGGVLFRDAPTPDEPTPGVRLFVPSRLSDNPALAEGDPSYRARLQALGAEDRKAQLEGDWNVYKGARFADFRTDLHVVEPGRIALPPPGTSRRAVGVDYGSASPFVALWLTELDDGTLYAYREVSGTRLTPRQQAEAILAAEAEHERTPAHPLPVALDSACWASSPDEQSPLALAPREHRKGPPRGSIADTYQRSGVPVEESDKRRLEGVALIAELLLVREDTGRPGLVIASTCTKLIETLPALQRDPKRVEDVLKGSEDHWYDALRYGVMRLRRGVAPSGPPSPDGPRRAARPDPYGPPRPGVPSSTPSATGAAIPARVWRSSPRRQGF